MDRVVGKDAGRWVGGRSTAGGEMRSLIEMCMVMPQVLGSNKNEIKAQSEAKGGYEIITLDDGRVFPGYEGEALSWSIHSYITDVEERKGFPKAKAVIRAMAAERPAQLKKERKEMLKGSFDRMFGHNAEKVMKLIDDEFEG